MANCVHCECAVEEYSKGKWRHADKDHFDSGCCYFPVPEMDTVTIGTA